MRRENPFPLHGHVFLQDILLEHLDLLVRMYVDAVGRQTRDYRLGQGTMTVDWRHGVELQGGPVVLVLEIVENLRGQSVLMRIHVWGGIWGLGSGDEGRERRWLRFGHCAVRLSLVRDLEQYRQR